MLLSWLIFFDSEYSQEENKLFYQQLLFRLAVNHIRVLAFTENYLGEEAGQRYENSKILREAIKKEFGRKGLEESLIHGLIKDLDSMGLLNATQSSVLSSDIYRLYVSELERKILNQIKD